MMKKIKIVADNKIPFLKGVFEPFADIEYYPGTEITNDKIIDADALITRTRTKCNESLLNNSSVKLITTATIGYDHIDVEYCYKKGIKWLNAPGCNSTSVMQYISSALYYLAKKDNFNLSDKTIGIIGVGNVGSKVCKAAEIYGMKVLMNDPPRGREERDSDFVDISEIQENADIITFHVPLNKDGQDKTFHLGSDDFFSKLKKKPIIINSSRGEVIDTTALKNALRNGLINNVVLDVWENEPVIDLELLEMVDIATPHIAGYSADGKANGTAVCVNAVNKFFDLGICADWYPENIPNAENRTELKLECDGKSEQRVFEEAVLLIYNIKKDDAKLRLSPHTFEKQRGDYPIRREYANYTIQSGNCNSDLLKKLNNLGFKVNI